MVKISVGLGISAPCNGVKWLIWAMIYSSQSQVCEPVCLSVSLCTIVLMLNKLLQIYQQTIYCYVLLPNMVHYMQPDHFWLAGRQHIHHTTILATSINNVCYCILPVVAYFMLCIHPSCASSFCTMDDGWGWKNKLTKIYFHNLLASLFISGERASMLG